jgi:hypothetical protein
MSENDDSVLKVVRLFIDNINESTKNTVKELDKLGNQVDNVKTKINTPPRNEELSLQIQEVGDKIDTVASDLTTIGGRIKSMIISVRVAALVMAFAIILAGGIIHYGKYVENKDMDKLVQKVGKLIDSIEKYK